MEGDKRPKTEAAIGVDIDSPPPWEAVFAKREEKYRRYEAAYTQRLTAKYFPKKAIDGGVVEADCVTNDIFKSEVKDIIKVERSPCVKSVFDPFQFMEEEKKFVVPQAASASIKEEKAASPSIKEEKADNFSCKNEPI